MLQPSGPSIHFWMSEGSVWARYTASGEAAKRRVTTTCVSPSVFRAGFAMTVIVCPSWGVPGQKSVQPLVVPLQCLSQRGKPLIDIRETLGSQTARASCAVYSTRDETCFLQNTQVPGDRGLGHFEGRCQLHHRGLAHSEPRQNGPPRGVAESGELGVQVHLWTVRASSPSQHQRRPAPTASSTNRRPTPTGGRRPAPRASRRTRVHPEDASGDRDREDCGALPSRNSGITHSACIANRTCSDRRCAGARRHGDGRNRGCRRGAAALSSAKPGDLAFWRPPSFVLAREGTCRREESDDLMGACLLHSEAEHRAGVPVCPAVSTATA